MPNEQVCDGSRPACDAAMAQLAATQARAAAANDALLDTVADLSRYQAQSAEFERVYERERRRAEAAESRVRELEAEHNGGAHYWRERDYKALLDIERLFKPEAESIELAPNPAINRIQAVISARDAADARAAAAENLLRRVLACALVGHEADVLRQDIQQALVRSHIVHQAAEKETTMDVTTHNDRYVVSSNAEPPAVPAPQQKWWIDHNSKVLRYGWACRITNGQESLWLEPDDTERIAADLNDVATYRGLLRDVLAGRGIHTSAQGVFVVELNPDLHRRIRTAVEGKEGSNA